MPAAALSAEKKPATATGTLVVHKANPSGLAANDDQLTFPVKF